MIISNAKNFIFVHIPKTGGTSLARALEEKVGARDILLGDTPKAVNRRRRQRDLKAAGRLWKHSTLGDIDGLVSAHDIERMKVFTIVRNPWDWCVSYYHWLREQGFDHPAVKIAKAVTFEGFLQDKLVQDSLKTMRYGDYVTDASGALKCDLFLRHENLNAAPDKLGDLLGFKLPALGHENASDRPEDYRSCYSDESRELVASLRSPDIARFDYAF